MEFVSTNSQKFSGIIEGILETINSPSLSIPYEKENNVIKLNSVKKVNSIKPKGDIELKNIQYRLYDKRYIGRKQIKGRTITVYAKTQKECLNKLKTEISKVLTFSHSNNANKFLFKDMFLSWFENERKPFVTKSTQDDILLTFKKLEPFHTQSIKNITKEKIQNLLKTLEDNRGKEKVRLYLIACLKYYNLEGITKVNACANVKVKKTYTSKTAFTYEQQIEILNALNNKELKVIVLIYLITGLRRRELNFKSIENGIDIENRILKAVNLKGRNFIKRYKQIKLSNQALKLIMNNLDIIHKYDQERAYREFAVLLKKLNIKGSMVTLRHTFATNCFYLGKPELIISREMGHSTSQITKDIYTDIDYHLSADKIRNLYNNLYNENWHNFWHSFFTF